MVAYYQILYCIHMSLLSAIKQYFEEVGNENQIVSM